ncbi:MAG: GNAT family N-acetyltransferase [Roseibium sp.]|uniref:GNAT family N-acetyltransferase n=1 Tax=Roseibium sp. TaxID=1936156 RepID=UPI00262F5C63|nr:GNAT family N-acetyltransferase [Roseibium sp.]MCV0429041.1 GNAT family N-acetyltransferase [Roseibium sp.]
MIVRQATRTDAQAMSEILVEIFKEWGSDRQSDPEFVTTYYIEHPDNVRCSIVAEDDGTVIGFQALKKALEGNIFDLPAGWGIIGTYVSMSAGRKGAGSALFASSVEAARKSGLENIDETIGKANSRGQAYYEAMGFRTYRELPTAVGKCFKVLARSE